MRARMPMYSSITDARSLVARMFEVVLAADAVGHERALVVDPAVTCGTGIPPSSEKRLEAHLVLQRKEGAVAVRSPRPSAPVSRSARDVDRDTGRHRGWRRIATTLPPTLASTHSPIRCSSVTSPSSRLPRRLQGTPGANRRKEVRSRRWRTFGPTSWPRRCCNSARPRSVSPAPGRCGTGFVPRGPVRCSPLPRTRCAALPGQPRDPCRRRPRPGRYRRWSSTWARSASSATGVRCSPPRRSRVGSPAS